MKALNVAGIGLAALLAGVSLAAAKTLVYCSEGSPENFTPAINTTGTSFDAARPVYNRLTEFKRGTTEVVPGLAESWDITDGGKTITFHLRKGVKFHSLQGLQADARFQRRRRPVFDRPAVEARQSLLQGVGRQVRLFQRHGHAEAARFGDQDGRLHRRHQAERAECRHPRQSGDGLHGDRIEGIRRLPAQEGDARAVRSGAGRHRAVLVRLVPEGFRHPLQGEQGLLRREGLGRRPRLRHHARSDRALRQAQGGRMPRQRLSAARRP